MLRFVVSINRICNIFVLIMLEVFSHITLKILNLTGTFLDQELGLQNPACIIGDLSYKKRSLGTNKISYQ